MVAKRAVGIAVLAVLACSAWGQTDVQCSAHANLMITVTGGGKCWAKVGSHCEAFAQSVSQYKEAFADWFGGDFEGKVCDKVKREAAATAVAKAISEVYTSSYTSIQCTRRAQGSACGWSQSDGTAWAIATADAVAFAYADAGGDSAKGVCTSDIRAVAAVVSDVAANALTDGCVNGNGGKIFRWSESFQRSLQEGIAKAFAKATAQVCSKGYYEASASVECEGDASSDVKGDTDGSFTSGDATGSAKGGEVPACTKGVRSKCCQKFYRASSCRCASDNGCERGLYSRTSDYKNDILRTWVAPGGAKCVCVL